MLDTFHFVSHVYPRSSPYRFPVGKISSLVTVDNVLSSACARKRPALCSNNKSLPPSVRRRLNDLVRVTESSTWLSHLPCIRTDTDVESLAPIWASVLAGAQTEARCEAVPISLSTHEDRMLTYGRDVPLCSLGEVACAAMQYPGNQGPLPIYVMPSVQDLIDKGRPPPAPFKKNSVCLLCIRRDVHAAVLAVSSMVANPSAQINRGACYPPPFTNLVDVPGGYRSDAMVTHGREQNVFGPVSIVGSHRSLVCRICPETRTWFFDQSAIKIHSPAFLGPGATEHSMR